MDTDQKKNTQHVNSFTKGMNSDTSYDMVDAEHYLFGQNIRITNNTNLNGDITSSTKENIVTAISNGVEVQTEGSISGHILATASIGNIGAVIVRNSDPEGLWSVYKAELEDGKIKYTHIFTSSETTDKDRFSVVINKELEDCIKLYIADGRHSVMCIDLLADSEYYGGLSEEHIISNHIFPTNRVKIEAKISGQLKTQQLQYTYRFYKKYGVASKLAPLTNKIQVIDDSRNKEIGNAENTKTSIGFKLSIDYTDSFLKVFDHIQIYRISYIKTTEIPEVNLICDSKLSSGESFLFNDTGVESLASLTLDEFTSMNGTVIIPQVLEQNQNILFAANIKDDTIFKVSNLYNPRAYQFNQQHNIILYSDTIYTDSKQYTNENDVEDSYYLNEYVDINDNHGSDCRYDKDGFLGGTGPNISWRFITCNIPLDYSSGKNFEIDQEHQQDNKLYYIKYVSGEYILVDSNKTVLNYFSDKSVYEDSFTYDNICTSSLFRSLRRDEVYRYGIIFYDKYGNRSDVLWIADIRTPALGHVDIVSCTHTVNDNIVTNLLDARPLGIEFNVNFSSLPNVIGYEIVRCEKTNATSKNLILVALSRPMREGKFKNETGTELDAGFKTPYYPNMFLTTQFMYDTYRESSYVVGNRLDYIDENYDLYTHEPGYSVKTNEHTSGTNVENNYLFLLFSSLINVARVDELNNLNSSSLKLVPVCYADNYEQYPYYNIFNHSAVEDISDGFVHPVSKGVYLIMNKLQNYNPTFKVTSEYVGKMYNRKFVLYAQQELSQTRPSFDSISIKKISDVNNPTWEDGFSDIQINGSEITSAVKRYKLFISNVGQYMYVNWVCNGMYDLAATKSEAESIYGHDFRSVEYTIGEEVVIRNYTLAFPYKYGVIGPGPICFIAQLDNRLEDSVLSSNITYIADDLSSSRTLGTICANIQHTALQFAGLDASSKQYDTYSSYGNFTTNNSNIVFDGNIYIVPCEFVNMYKAYNFNDYYTIKSRQMVYFIPMESTINTYFDYGMNYHNTINKNIQLKPGSINGVSTQDRPVHQYNLIYSDNERSIVKYTSQSEEDSIQQFKQRIYYSQNKTNGENIDNWNIFKPIDYIDADSRYGEITHLLSANNTLYYWQTNAFGKLSVNERSLITDTNNNTIQLGQGGVLQRTDYINTFYGMQPDHLSAIAIDGSVYWIDSKNKAIVAGNGERVINYCEAMNVLNISNSRFSNTLPQIDYDLQNMELLCKTYKDNEQLVFNLKLPAATAIYTRDYDSTITFNNVLYGLKNDGSATRLNYNEEEGDLLPTKLEFVVNAVPSVTKVFDNQQINITDNTTNYEDDFAENRTFTFSTDLCRPTIFNDLMVTDREGNINYAVPRENNAEYGNRMRGKWMKVTITDDNPSKDFAISHIITKFRYSFI